jgi:uncharacterized membrane protein (DUF2068 family)
MPDAARIIFIFICHYAAIRATPILLLPVFICHGAASAARYWRERAMRAAMAIRHALLSLTADAMLLRCFLCWR